jgi:hypothetical protein
LIKNKSGHIFLAWIFFDNDGRDADDILIGILDFLRDDLELDPSFLLRLILNTGKDGDSILHYNASTCYNKLNFSKLLAKLFPWIEQNYSQSTLKNLILLKNSDGQNFLFKIFFMFRDYWSSGSFSVEAIEAFLKILSYCFEFFEDKELIADILNSKADCGQTLRKYFVKNCGKNGFDESLKSFNQFLTEKCIETNKILRMFNRNW